MNRYDIFSNWEYIEDYFAGFEHGEGEGTKVRLPHSRKGVIGFGENEKSSSPVYGYRRRLDVPQYWEKQRVFITFDGVVENAVIYVNGMRIAVRQSAHPRFTMEVTDLLEFGSSNLLCVEIIDSENTVSPCGMYRGVWIETTANTLEESFARLIEMPRIKQSMVMPLC
ncbi:MAG: hypothetical protein E7559_09395 [Ruminococcaceae bacterium]|nr:hypothetical protein [Oscillospiraceae bacterium]